MQFQFSANVFIAKHAVRCSNKVWWFFLVGHFSQSACFSLLSTWLFHWALLRNCKLQFLHDMTVWTLFIKFKLQYLQHLNVASHNDGLQFGQAIQCEKHHLISQAKVTIISCGAWKPIQLCNLPKYRSLRIHENTHTHTHTHTHTNTKATHRHL
jgi:hypothetical protein